MKVLWPFFRFDLAITAAIKDLVQFQFISCEQIDLDRTDAIKSGGTAAKASDEVN